MTYTRSIGLLVFCMSVFFCLIWNITVLSVPTTDLLVFVNVFYLAASAVKDLCRDQSVCDYDSRQQVLNGWTEKLLQVVTLTNHKPLGMLKKLETVMFFESEPFLLRRAGYCGTKTFLGMTVGGKVVTVSQLPIDLYKNMGVGNKFATLLSVQHANVARYICTETDPYYGHVVTEYYDWTLRDYMTARGKSFPLSARNVVKQFLRGLQAIHGHRSGFLNSFGRHKPIQIVHCAITPDNVFLGKSLTSELKCNATFRSAR